MFSEAFNLFRERSCMVTRRALISANRPARCPGCTRRCPVLGISGLSPVDTQVLRCPVTSTNTIPSVHISSKAAVPCNDATGMTTPRVTSKTSAVKAAEHIKQKGAQIIECVAVNHGKQLEITFADLSRYRLHAEWIQDASPSNAGPDFYRKSAADIWKLENFWVSQVEVSLDGQTLILHYQSEDGASRTEEMKAEFLHACAPFVGKSLHANAEPFTIKGTGSLLHSANIPRQTWMCDLAMPTFDAEEVATDLNVQVQLLETMIRTGVAHIKNLGPPESLQRERAGLPMEQLVNRIVGRMNQHPVRSTRYFMIQKAADIAQGQDYDMQKPLSMHTDHTVYDGTPGFLQFMYQAEGSCRSKVCDGVALADYMREHHPEEFKVLTTTDITHSSRNNLYTPNGSPRNVADPTSEGWPFELVHTHPVIQLDEDGQVEKVAQSETKRGVCALSFDEYELFMKAYKLWINLCEDQRFVKHFDWPEHSMVVMNNWQILHGRASVPPGMARTMVGGYITKTNFENRYRLLKQMQTEQANPSLNAAWLTRLPNQILAKMIN